MYNMIQDKKGYLWFATDNGVFRYDGKDFTRYSTENGLPDNDVLSVEEDQLGRIWIACYNNNFLCIERGKLHNGRGGTNFMTFKSYMRLLGYRADTLVFHVNSQPDAVFIQPNGTIQFKQHPDIDFYCGNDAIKFSKSKIYLYDFHFKKVDSFKTDNPNEIIDAVYKLSDSTFLIKTNMQVILGNIHHQRLHLQNQKLSYLQQNKLILYKQELWMYEDSTLFPIKPDLRIDSSRKRNTYGIHFFSFLLDNRNDLWLSTEGDGVYYLPQNGVQLYTEEDGLVNQNITCASMLQDTLYTVGVTGKVNRLAHHAIETLPINLEKFAYGKVKSILAHGNFLFFGYSKGHLLVYNKHNGTTHLISNIGSVKHLASYSKDSILYCSSSRSGFIQVSNLQVYPLFGERGVAAGKIQDGKILVAGINNLRLYEKQGKEFVLVNKTNLPNTIISDIQHLNGITVLSTFEQGIYIVSGKDTQHLTTANGLTDNNCKYVYIENAHHIWASTSSGLNHIIYGLTASPVVENLTTKNGLASNNISHVFKIENTYYTTSSKGINTFSLDRFYHEQIEPLLDIHDIYVNNKPVFPVGDLKLQPGEQLLKLTVSVLDFRSFGNLHIRYRVNGLDTSWTYTTQNIIELARLQPGTYTLEIQSLGAFHKVAASSVTLKFQVLPFWWQLTWVRIAAFIAFIAITAYGIYLFFLRRYHQKVKQENLLKQITETELKAIKAQINPHFIFNTLNAIQYFISNSENEKAGNYLDLMSKLIRKTLDFSNEISSPLKDEMAYLQTYVALESLRFEEEDFELQWQDWLSEQDKQCPFPTMVLQPHVENAIRHGLKPKKQGKKILKLSFYKKENTLFVEVEDNGIGRQQSTLQKSQHFVSHRSHGDELSKSKLSLFEQFMKKKVTLRTDDLMENNNSIGTRVILSVEL